MKQASAFVAFVAFNSGFKYSDASAASLGAGSASLAGEVFFQESSESELSRSALLSRLHNAEALAETERQTLVAQQDALQALQTEQEVLSNREARVEAQLKLRPPVGGDQLPSSSVFAPLESRVDEATSMAAKIAQALAKPPSLVQSEPASPLKTALRTAHAKAHHPKPKHAEGRETEGVSFVVQRRKGDGGHSVWESVTGLFESMGKRLGWKKEDTSHRGKDKATSTSTSMKSSVATKPNVITLKKKALETEASATSDAGGSNAGASDAGGSSESDAGSSSDSSSEREESSSAEREGSSEERAEPKPKKEEDKKWYEEGWVKDLERLDTFEWRAKMAAFGAIQALLVGILYKACIYKEYLKFREDQEDLLRHDGRWQFDLFDCSYCCGADWRICLAGWCCTSARWADTASKVQPPMMGYFMWLLVVVLLSMGSNITWGVSGAILLLIVVYNRARIRENYGINSDGIFTDVLTWCCCSPCAVIQEARQIEYVKQPEMFAS